MSGRRQLIVNADDFGRSPGINEGIVRAHLCGFVTSTTLMVNTPWSAVAVDASARAPDLAIGLHLNFCYGRPVSTLKEIPSLIASDGILNPNIGQLLETARAEDIRAETHAQIRRFHGLVGRMPSHLDSHKYVHSYAPFTVVVAEVAASLALPVRSIGDDDRAAVRELGVPTTDQFEGRFHGLDGEGVDRSILERAIEEVPEGTTELMCHPGIVDDAISDSSYRDDRERELQLLCSPGIRRLVDEAGIELVDFYQLAP